MFVLECLDFFTALGSLFYIKNPYVMLLNFGYQAIGHNCSLRNAILGLIVRDVIHFKGHGGLHRTIHCSYVEGNNPGTRKSMVRAVCCSSNCGRNSESLYFYHYIDCLGTYHTLLTRGIHNINLPGVSLNIWMVATFFEQKAVEKVAVSSSHVT